MIARAQVQPEIPASRCHQQKPALLENGEIHSATLPIRQYLSYISTKMLFFNLAKLARDSGTEVDPEGKDLKRVISQIFDNYDLKADSQKIDQGLKVWNNEAVMAQDGGRLAKIKEAKTREEILGLCKDITVGLWYGDFHSPNDGYPLQMQSNQRRRMWYKGEWATVLRIENSQALIDGLLSPQLPTIIEAPKL